MRIPGAPRRFPKAPKIDEAGNRPFCSYDGVSGGGGGGSVPGSQVYICGTGNRLYCGGYRRPSRRSWEVVGSGFRELTGNRELNWAGPLDGTAGGSVGEENRCGGHGSAHYESANPVHRGADASRRGRRRGAVPALAVGAAVHCTDVFAGCRHSSDGRSRQWEKRTLGCGRLCGSGSRGTATRAEAGGRVLRFELQPGPGDLRGCGGSLAGSVWGARAQDLALAGLTERGDPGESGDGIAGAVHRLGSEAGARLAAVLGVGG